jgi:hypothetical protein
MPIVNYYLKKPDGDPPRSLIYLQFKYNGQKLVYSFGQKINPVDWSKEKKRVKSNRQTILTGLYALNELLDELESNCLDHYQKEMKHGIPAVSLLRFRLDTFIRHKQGRTDDPTLFLLFDQLISDGLKNYATTKGHLLKFDIAHRYYVDLEKINLDFFHRYTTFLREELKLKPNSIARDIGAIRTVMSKALDVGLTSNIQWRHKQFSYPTERSRTTRLTEKEITRLSRYDLSENKRLESIRDLFVLACLTGLPYEQCTLLRTDGIVQIRDKPYLQTIRSNKGPLFIPCHPIVLQILEKYQARMGRMPRTISNQKFNLYIKEACSLAGVSQWQHITSRTALRSFNAG